MRKLLHIALLAALGVAGTACRDAEAVADDPLAVEGERILVDYLKVDTTNPPGNETRGASLLYSVFQREGIEAQLVGDDPNRRALYARLRSSTTAPALLLLNHIDVVPADAAEWTLPPFSGAKSGGYIWGRGALDAKALAVAQMMAMIALKREGAKLSRDVVFLAVPDEESGGLRGAKAILERYPQLFAGVGYVLNEGGANKTVVDRVTLWGIEVDQKVPLWVEVSTRGAGGHAAIPPAQPTAIQKLSALIRDLEAMPMEESPAALERRKPGGTAATPPRVDALLERDTLVVTAIRAGNSVNSLPSHASALVDCRLIPGKSSAPLLARIREVVGDRGTVNVLVAGEPAPPSPIDTPLYAVLRRELARAEKGSRVAPIVSPGTTDSRFFRARGVTAYGFSPFKLNFYDYGSIHGADEKIRISYFREGVRVMRDVVSSFAAARE